MTNGAFHEVHISLANLLKPCSLTPSQGLALVQAIVARVREPEPVPPMDPESIIKVIQANLARYAGRTSLPIITEFDRCADATLDEVKAIYTQRGEEYADSWALENQRAPFTNMVLRDILGFENGVEPEVIRLIVMAALVDVKDSRMIGPYKRDTVVDGIAYIAMFAQIIEEYKEKCNSPLTSSSSRPEPTPTDSSEVLTPSHLVHTIPKRPGTVLV